MLYTQTLSKKIALTGVLLAVCFLSFAQSNCDTTLINAYLNPAGYTRLYVPGQPCSMYYYNPTPMYGIDARQSSLSLGIPQLMINNAVEDSEVSASLYASGVYFITPAVWLGITDSATNYGASPYHWRTFAGDTNIAYFNWIPGEPNNAPPSCKIGSVCLACFGVDAYWCEWGEDCAVLTSSGQWNDLTCLGSGVTHISVLEVNTCPVLSVPSDMTLCAGASVQVMAADTGGTAPYTYTWGSGGPSGQTVTLSPSSTDTITVMASDRFQCMTDSTFIITINPNAPVADAGPDVRVCAGASDTLGAAPDANYSYSWTPAWGLSSTTSSSPVFSIATSPSQNPLDTFYTLTATWGACSSTDTVRLTLYPNVYSTFLLDTSSCGDSGIVVAYTGALSDSATYTWDFDSTISAVNLGQQQYILTWSSNGVKTVSLDVAEYGCVANPYSQMITLYPYPTAVISANGLVLSTDTFASYQWLENGSAISGATSRTIIAGSNGPYQVFVTDSHGCTDTSAIYMVKGVGINEINGLSSMIIYPNPNNGTFTLQAPLSVGEECIISDPLGHIIHQQMIKSDYQVIDLAGLAEGIYTLSVKGASPLRFVVLR